VEGVVATDLALSLGLIDLDGFRDYVRSHRQAPGVARARQAAEWAEPKSESPMETRLRMVLVLAGLPRPEAQVSLNDSGGSFLGRPDLYYPDARLAIEFDGANHRDRLAEDNRRQNRLQQAGITLLRYTTPDIHDRPHAIVADVRAALASVHRAPSVDIGTLGAAK
jgi:hypothetical protein